jgi:hypothetical protein
LAQRNKNASLNVRLAWDSLSLSWFTDS